MKKNLHLFLFMVVVSSASFAQIVRPFTPRYYNSSVKGNIVYVSNSIISSAGVGSGIPGTGEVPPSGTSKDNSSVGINIDIDNLASVTKLPFNSTWNYHARNTAPANDGGGNNWKAQAYSISALWNSGGVGTGSGRYGYNGTQQTCLPSGCTPVCTPVATCDKYTAFYFRRDVSFTAAELSTGFTSVQLNLKRNDGVVIYINGVERARNNMPTGTPVFSTLASSNIALGSAEDYSVNLSTSAFTIGVNTIAVEIHTAAIKSADMSFDMEVLGLNDNGTYNSSSSDLAIPTSCNQVLFAGLYWGADQGNSGTNTSWITGAYNSVKLKLPGSPVYQTVSSQQTDLHSDALSPGLPHTGYLCFKDITSIVNTSNPNGTYTVADMVGPVGILNACGGWTIVIVYSNPTLQPRNLTVFDGSVIINQGDPPVDVNISGFLTPPGGPVSCELGAVVYDGDRGSTDAFSFRQNGAIPFYNLATTTIPGNNANDAWNSKIWHKGNAVTTRAPFFHNTLGYDASIFDLPNTANAQLSNSQTGATVRFSSPGENYFVHVLTTSISQYNPTFAFSKSATDINGSSLVPGDSIRYAMNFQNLGNDASINTQVVDNIPSGTTYLRNSLRIGGVAKTDAPGDDEAEFDLANNRVVFRVGTGATSLTGGNIPINGTGNVQFDVIASSSCHVLACTNTIQNSARMNYVGLTSLALLYDSSGINNSGCINPGPVILTPVGSCYTPGDTLLVNRCPATSVLIPWRRYAGYQIYAAQPFVPANLFNPLTPVTSSHVYWAYFDNGYGCSDTIRIRVYVIVCPDIDDDNDGIPDYVELNNPLALADHDGDGIPNWNDATYPGFVDNNADGFNDNFDPSADTDNDGILNFYDPDFPGYIDTNADAVNDRMDKDLDGIPNHLDLDSDNDGIPDVVESYGVDTNGDGVIDNYIDLDNDGFSQNVDANITGVNMSGVGLGAPDLDSDGIPNYLDNDSDNDGIPDVVEVFGPDANNDGKIDSYFDTDGDGYSDAVDGDVGNDGIAENFLNSLLRTGPDLLPINGRADNYPYKNKDDDRRPNPYDLDSDGDGIVDVLEAGFMDANYNGMIDGPISTDGWNTALHALPALNLRNTDGRSYNDFLDIDSDDDGIPDNIEGQSTNGYVSPTGVDTDNDGIDNAYDLAPLNNSFGGSGIFIYDHDADGLPDYRDLDTDSDGIADIVEGNDFNRNGVMDDAVSLTFLDMDDDGLDNRFDSLISILNIKGTSYNLGTGGSILGDLFPGTRAPVQKTFAYQTDRDWRYTGYVLNISSLNLSGAMHADLASLQWNIMSSVAIDRFDIERSIDNIHFTKVSSLIEDITVNVPKMIAASDQTTDMVAEIIYYRVKLIAKNGQSSYSNTIPLRKSGIRNASVTIHPNPAAALVSMRFFADKQEDAFITLTDNVGKIVVRMPQRILRGNNSIQLTGLARFPDGAYILQLRSETMLITQKLIIHNH